MVGRFAGGASGLPLAAAVAVRLLLIAAMLLVYLFVRRERGHPYFGFAGMIVFGVSAVYQEGVYWFAASPALAHIPEDKRIGSTAYFNAPDGRNTVNPELADVLDVIGAYFVDIPLLLLVFPTCTLYST